MIWHLFRVSVASLAIIEFVLQKNNWSRLEQKLLQKQEVSKKKAHH